MASIWDDQALVNDLVAFWSEGGSATVCARRLSEKYNIEITRNSVISKIDRLRKAHGEDVLPRRDNIEEARRVVQRRHRVNRAKAERRRVERKAPPKRTGTRDAFVKLLAESVEPVPEVVDDIPIEQRRTVLTIEANECRWPVGDPQSSDFHFCGGKAVEGLPYCEPHARRAYQGPRDSQQKPPANRGIRVTGSQTYPSRHESSQEKELALVDEFGGVDD